MVGKLEKSLYGTRDAFIAMGCKKGMSSPCSFHHEGWDLSTKVHGDDFFTEGPVDSLIKMNLALE